MQLRPYIQKKGKKQVKELSSYYLENAKLIRQAVTGLGLACTGGENSPYIWVDSGTDSWEFFSMLLMEAGVVTTPGAGFGRCGQGFIRISAFNSRANVEKALVRIKEALK